MDHSTRPITSFAFWSVVRKVTHNGASRTTGRRRSVVSNAQALWTSAAGDHTPVTPPALPGVAR
eukprot:6701856-Lingulodinium_polyedra.AAC.1